MPASGVAPACSRRAPGQPSAHRPCRHGPCRCQPLQVVLAAVTVLPAPSTGACCCHCVAGLLIGPCCCRRVAGLFNWCLLLSLCCRPLQLVLATVAVLPASSTSPCCSYRIAFNWSLQLSLCCQSLQLVLAAVDVLPAAQTMTRPWSICVWHRCSAFL